MSEMLAFKKKNKIKQNSLLEEPTESCTRQNFLKNPQATVAL